MRLFCFYICGMVDITQVYEILRDLSNKDQRGFVTQNEFNNFAAAAQTKIYNEIFSEVLQANKLRRQQVDGKGAQSLLRQKQEDLAYYISEYDLFAPEETDANYYETQANEDSAEVQDQVGTQTQFVKPNDVRYIIAIYAGELDAVGQSAIPCEIIRDASKYRRVLNSRLSQPTAAFPTAFIGDRTIRISPATGLRATMTYYRQARSRYTGTQVSDVFNEIIVDGGTLDVSSMPILVGTENNNGVNIINHQNTRNFDLPEHYLPEVVMEMAHMIGMNVRDTNLIQYGMKLSSEQ